MPSDNWFRRNSNRPSEGSALRKAAPASAPTDVPDGLAVKCAKCGEIIFNKDFEKSLKVCPKCGHHHRLSSDERIAYTVDEGSFEEFAQTTGLKSADFLSFPDYKDKLEKAWSKKAEGDSFRVGIARIEGCPLVLGVSEFGFMGGSMGSVMGDKIAIAIEEAISRGLPVLLFTMSGGARMQEGLTSLMQMAKTSAACARLAQAGLPLVVVLADPTTGGVMASFASLGDVLLAEPGALAALAGQRVAAQAAQGEKLPANYQSSEWRAEKGHIDSVVHRRDMRSILGRLLSLLSPNQESIQVPATSSATEPSAAGNSNGNGDDRDISKPKQRSAIGAAAA